jgi:hypothetical protein
VALQRLGDKNSTVVGLNAAIRRLWGGVDPATSVARGQSAADTNPGAYRHTGAHRSSSPDSASDSGTVWDRHSRRAALVYEHCWASRLQPEFNLLYVYGRGARALE